MARCGNLLECLLYVLKGVAAFLGNVVQAIERWIRRIEEFICSLDAKCPAWREIES